MLLTNGTPEPLSSGDLVIDIRRADRLPRCPGGARRAQPHHAFHALRTRRLRDGVIGARGNHVGPARNAVPDDLARRQDGYVAPVSRQTRRKRAIGTSTEVMTSPRRRQLGRALAAFPSDATSGLPGARTDAHGPASPCLRAGAFAAPAPTRRARPRNSRRPS